MSQTRGKLLRRAAAIVLAFVSVFMLWGAGDQLDTFADVAARHPWPAAFLLVTILLIAGGFIYLAYALWFATGISNRMRFLGSYFASVFLLLAFLMPMGDEAWAYILLINYGLVTAAALVFPERYCTVLKGVSLAGSGALLPLIIGRAMIYFWRT